jgi:two-component system, response regulator RegA
MPTDHDDRMPTVLVVDDDETFASTLARALERRGWKAEVALSSSDAAAALRGHVPDSAVVDLRIGQESGLDLIPALRGAGPAMRIIVLTGYASIATAVQAIKLGADDYLAKPVTAANVVEALRRGARGAAEVREDELTPMSPRRLEWEHIQRVLAEHGGNISATARSLNMHRRTLQRKLSKRPTQR